MSARGKALTLVGVVTLAGTMFAVPMWIRNRMGGSLTAKDGELTGSQVQRGQFMNSGSRDCLLYTSPSPRDQRGSRMPSSA